jgi:hypothetical protein
MPEIDLPHLRWHWGSAYRVSRRRKRWVAVRRDNRRELSAGSGRALLDAIRSDYLSEPVSRDCTPEPMGRQISDVAGRAQP